MPLLATQTPPVLNGAALWLMTAYKEAWYAVISQRRRAQDGKAPPAESNGEN